MIKYQHYIKPQWPVSHRVNAYTTTREEGYSLTPYSSFNLAAHVGDDSEHVEANRKRLQQELNLVHDPVWLNQVHSKSTVFIDNPSTLTPTADSSITTQSHIVCAVLTADCLPVLLCNTQGTIVAAVHAGWRGLLAGVIEETLLAMNIPAHETLVWLGPAIGPNAFEVSQEFCDLFISEDKNASKAFREKEEGKWLADIYTLARQRLKRCGVENVYGGTYCTYSDSNHYFSYRRDNGQTGRMASLIWLQ